jgi:Prealbumin-like fold domain
MRHKSTSLVIALALLSSLVGCNKNGTIPIKAAIVYKMGGSQPVARTKFYLLREDITTKVKGSWYSTRSGSVGILEDRVKDYVVMTTTTDFEGNAKFENVPLGTYYIVGFTRIRSEYGFVVWNLKVDAKTDAETILIDQNNALEVGD